jgi:hypothetical protein
MLRTDAIKTTSAVNLNPFEFFGRAPNAVPANGRRPLPITLRCPALPEVRSVRSRLRGDGILSNAGDFPLGWGAQLVVLLYI